MMNLLKNGNSYLNDSKKRSLFLGFDKIFKSVNKGFFFNTESIYEFAKNRDNPDYLSQFSPVYIKRMLDIIAQNSEEWQKLDDISVSDWSALFTNETSKSYSEKLLLMEHLPMIYEMPKIKQKLKDAELVKKNIYSCPQTMFKFHPDFDHILAEILKKDKKGVLYLIKDNNKVYFNKLIERFKKIKFFDLDRVIFLDPLSRDNYINHLGTSSVLLDPLYFGAGNSFHESMVYGTPTVTMPTKYIKSRIVSAAYMQMEIEKPPIVKNKNEYVELAIDIANSDNLLEIKKYYQKKAIEKLFNTTKAGEEFNQILLNLYQ